MRAVSPAALSSYARIAGWRRCNSYREHSDIYEGDSLPEIVVPLTQRLGDYASAVAALIKIFAQVAGQDELTVYRALTISDRDVIRIRVAESDDGSLGLDDGAKLIEGVCDMVLSVACSLYDSRPVYRTGANEKAVDLLRQMRLGQTDQGSFVVTLLTPTISPSLSLFKDLDDQDLYGPNAPLIRQMTGRLVEALTAVRWAAERASSGDGGVFAKVVAKGVSANLCEALVRIVEPFPKLDISVSWAGTRPMKMPPVYRFGRSDASLLREAAHSLRERAPKPDVRLLGFVRILKRSEDDADGTVRLRTEIDGQWRSIAAILEQADYECAVQAHKDRAPVELKGDLERTSKQWRLLNPQLERVLRDDEDELKGG